MMKKALSALLVLFLLLSPALAEKSRVVDEADLLSVSDERQLEENIARIREKYHFDVLILTKETIGDRILHAYAADYYDYEGYGYGENKDGIMLFLVTGSTRGDRDMYTMKTGSGEKIFNEDVTYDIEEDVLPYFRMDDFSSGIARFVLDVEARLEAYQPLNRATRLLPIFGIAGLVIGLIVAFVLKGQMKTVRRKVGAASYIRQGSFQLTRQQDIYLYTTTRRRRIETPSSGGRSGGGGGGFTGSSGTHHTGSARKF